MTLTQVRKQLDGLAQQLAETDPDGSQVEHLNHAVTELALQLGKLLNNTTLPPQVYCPTCGHQFDRNVRAAIPADLQLAWDDLHFHERRVLAGMMLNHGGDPFQDWLVTDQSKKFHDVARYPVAAAARTNYRAVHNAFRRLVPCGWVQRVSRGVYRLTLHTVTTVGPMITKRRMTVEKLVPRVSRKRVRARHQAEDTGHE